MWVICGVHSVAFVRTVSLCVHVAVHPGSGDWVLILPDVWRLLDRRRPILDFDGVYADGDIRVCSLLSEMSRVLDLDSCTRLLVM